MPDVLQLALAGLGLWVGVSLIESWWIDWHAARREEQDREQRQ